MPHELSTVSHSHAHTHNDAREASVRTEHRYCCALFCRETPNAPNTQAPYARQRANGVLSFRLITADKMEEEKNRPISGPFDRRINALMLDTKNKHGGTREADGKRMRSSAGQRCVEHSFRLCLPNMQPSLIKLIFVPDNALLTSKEITIFPRNSSPSTRSNMHKLFATKFYS